MEWAVETLQSSGAVNWNDPTTDGPYAGTWQALKASRLPLPSRCAIKEPTHDSLRPARTWLSLSSQSGASIRQGKQLKNAPSLPLPLNVLNKHTTSASTLIPTLGWLIFKLATSGLDLQASGIWRICLYRYVFALPRSCDKDHSVLLPSPMSPANK